MKNGNRSWVGLGVALVLVACSVSMALADVVYVNGAAAGAPRSARRIAVGPLITSGPGCVIVVR